MSIAILILKIPVIILSQIFLSKWFLIFFISYGIMSYFLLKYIMKRTKKYREFQEKDEKTHSKYQMFRRLDIKHWNENSFLLGAILFSWLKLAGIFTALILCYISLKVLLWNKDINDPSIRRDRNIRKKIESIVRFCTKFLLISMGIIVNREEIELDYTPYLGSGYDKGDDNTIVSTYVSNHLSWMDPLILIDKIVPGFISKSDVLSYPFFGYFATCLGGIFVDRSDKNNRADIIKEIMERQTSTNSREEINQLLIFPEGTTTNNTGIIEFKQGAFLTKFNMKPYVIKFDPINKISLAMDVIEMLLHAFIILYTPVHYVTVYSLPVFIPNQYLFKNSKYANEDKEWKVYAETIRDIMCNASGLNKLSGNYQMKVEYLDYLRNSKENKKD